MSEAYCEVENADPTQHERWLAKHGFQPNEEGKFRVDSFEGRTPVEVDQLMENIRTNVSAGGYVPLFSLEYDKRTFVMVCGGPSLEDHLEEVREKASQPDKYLVVCSNMTGGYLLEQGITPHVHFILDPQNKKKFDVAKAHQYTQYWINAACDPEVFETLKQQDITPYIFLADFDAEGKAIKTVKESLPPGVLGMMAIQGGTMAGLRAINLADALGFRSLEYYGFDATVQVKDGKARPYAYEKKRGEAIIEIECDRCSEKFDTTLIFQKQVNEFIAWQKNMPWMQIKIIGGGLIAHYQKHVEEMKKPPVNYRYTQEYAKLQRELHAEGDYGNAGRLYTPSIFHGISQLAKRHGFVTVLDYGSSSGKTMQNVKDRHWLPPCITDTCYDPFVDSFAKDPDPADFVICTDVMEHVEPECTSAVLDHIQFLTKKLAFFSISLRPANKVLSDGRNAHINQRSPEYWLRELKKRFILSEAKVTSDGDSVLAIGESIEAVREAA